MASTSLTPCRNVSLKNGADDLLRRVRDALALRVGSASYSTALVYGLTLAAAHLGIDGPEPVPLPPDPRKPELAIPPPAPAKR